MFRTASDALEASFESNPSTLPPGLAKRIEDWRATATRLESEPESNDGRKELIQRAKAAEAARDYAAAQYHQYEISSAIFQLAIVLMSAMVVTGVSFLSVASIIMAAGAAAIGALGFLAPTLLHL